MFTRPIQYVRITSIGELKKFSSRVNGQTGHPLVHWQNNGQIAFTDQKGHLFVTPYRPEIRDLLASSGYEEKGLYVPFSNGEDLPEDYLWLRAIADQECWAYTYEKAFQVSQGLRLKEVVYPFQTNLHIKEITWNESSSADPASGFSCTPMISKYLLNSEQNIGTYIVIDTKTVLLCDEYGRTFLVKSKGVINDFVNALINAGYARTVNPGRYVKIAKTF